MSNHHKHHHQHRPTSRWLKGGSAGLFKHYQDYFEKLGVKISVDEKTDVITVTGHIADGREVYHTEVDTNRSSLFSYSDLFDLSLKASNIAAHANFNLYLEQ